MSGPQHPPPGWQPPQPEQPPSDWQQGNWGDVQQPGGWQQGNWGDFHQPGGWQQGNWAGYPPQPPHYRSPAAGAPVAHKPGAIPLRPLVLSDLFDGAFRIIRYNPGATIGAAVLVSAVAMVIPIAVGLASGATGGLAPGSTADSLSDVQVVRLLVAIGGLLAGTELQSVGLLFVSGMIAHVTAAAAVGRKLTMGEAWAATHGKRWRLLGMSLLLGLGAIVVTGIAVGALALLAVAGHLAVGAVVLLAILLAALLFAGYLWFWVRMRALAVPVLMLEPVGVFGAIGRAVRLTRRQFWRLLGLLLLMTLVVTVAGAILRAPFSVVGQVAVASSSSSGHGLLVYILLTAVGTVISSALLQPFAAAVVALLYLDQRIRKEAYDVELMSRAGIMQA